MIFISMSVSWIEKTARRCRSRANKRGLMLLLFSTSMLLVTGVEMERTKGACLQVTLQVRLLHWHFG